MPRRKNLEKQRTRPTEGSRNNIANKVKIKQGKVVSQTDVGPRPKKQRITIETLKTDIDTVKNDVQSIKEPLFGDGTNDIKAEDTPSGSVTPDKTISKDNQDQSETQMVPPLQSDSDEPILIQKAK